MRSIFCCDSTRLNQLRVGVERDRAAMGKPRRVLVYLSLVIGAFTSSEANTSQALKEARSHTEMMCFCGNKLPSYLLMRHISLARGALSSNFD